jgi:hypothetical protein
MTRLTRYIESRGFWFLLGGLCVLLYLGWKHRGIVAKPKPADNVVPMEEKRVPA